MRVKIVCGAKNNWHFSSMRCATLYCKRKFVLSYAVDDEK